MWAANESKQADRSPRSCKKLIRFTEEELATVNGRARDAGQPVACYIRDASLGARKRPARSPAMSSAVIVRLAGLATRLRSLKESATARGLPEATEFGVAVDELLSLIRQID